MKLAVLSDLHLGDPACSLVANGKVTPKFSALVERLRGCSGGTLDYLVLLGDCLDFSVASYAESYGAAQTFFAQLKAQALTDQLIYVPGNHDGSIWHIIRHEANIIDKINQNKPPIERWTVPGVLDARDQAKQPLVLIGVKPQPEGGYGGLYLDKLTGSTVNIVYPNLYLVEPEGNSVLLTHGHYFEQYWSFTLRFAREEILRDDLQLGSLAHPDIEDIVTINFPLNELACADIGQAGHLTANIRQIQADAKRHDLTRISKYVKRARDYVDRQIKFDGFAGWAKEYVTDKLLNAAEDAALKAIGGRREEAGARNNPGFLRDKDVVAAVSAYLEAVDLERAQISDVIIPDVTSVVFGHTHVPVLFDDPMPPTLLRNDGRTVKFHNTGGWLVPAVEGGSGVVFAYDSSKPSGHRWAAARVV